MTQLTRRIVSYWLTSKSKGGANGSKNYTYCVCSMLSNSIFPEWSASYTCKCNAPDISIGTIQEWDTVSYVVCFDSYFMERISRNGGYTPVWIG